MVVLVWCEQPDSRDLSHTMFRVGACSACCLGCLAGLAFLHVRTAMSMQNYNDIPLTQHGGSVCYVKNLTAGICPTQC